MSASTAVDAHAHGLAACLNNLRCHAVPLQLFLNLLQAAERVAVGARTAVDQQHLARPAARSQSCQHGRYGSGHGRTCRRHCRLLDKISPIHKSISGFRKPCFPLSFSGFSPCPTARRSDARLPTGLRRFPLGGTLKCLNACTPARPLLGFVHSSGKDIKKSGVVGQVEKE